MSNIRTINYDSVRDLDLDYAGSERDLSRFRHYHSTWNDILRATGQPLHDQGYRSIIDSPPRGFPGPNDFDILNLDLAYLLKRPEFWHWNIEPFGRDLMLRDLDLLDAGRMTLRGLFMRGPVSPVWYDKLREAEQVHKQNYLDEAREGLDRRIERLEDEIKQLYDDIEQYEEGIERVERRLEHCRAAERAIRRTASAAPAGTFHDHEQAEPQHIPHHQRPVCGTVHVNGRPHSASDVPLHHSLCPSRLQDTPVSPRTVPREEQRVYVHAPPPPMHSHSHRHVPSVSQTEMQPTLEGIEKLQDQIKRGQAGICSLHARQSPTEAGSSRGPNTRITIEGRSLYHAPSYILSSPPLTDMEEMCQRVGLDLSLFLSRLKADTEDLEQLARGYRASYERVRAEVEGTDEFGVRAGDVAGLSWGWEGIEHEGEGSGEAKGKEVARDA